MKQPRSWPRLPGRRRLAAPPRTRRARFEALEARRVLAAPTLADIGAIELLANSPLHIPLDAFDADGDTLTFTATSSNPDVTTYIPEGNRSMRIAVRSADGAIDGRLVLELFEDCVPRVTGRIIELAESGFYDGIIFHRVIDGFMIQGGDPTGTGSGGSGYPDFDDQFHVDLQHNTTGVLSMAKSSDDTNDCQFFIVDTPGAGSDYPRNLDFNHSVFGQLVEGFDVLDAISEASVHARAGSSEVSVPNVNIVMESVDVFVDNENGVLMLKAPEGYTGQTDVIVTVSDGHGGQDQVTFHVTVAPDKINVSSGQIDPHDGNPFLADTPGFRLEGTTDTFQLTAVDAEGDPGYFLYEGDLEYYQLPVPLWCHEDLEYLTDFNTGAVTVTAHNDLVGIHPITVATAVDAGSIDYQVVPVFIVPDEAPAAQLDMTLVRDLTQVDEMGEVNALPDDQWIDEWDEFTIEIWATVISQDQFGVHTVSTDLTFDKNLFTATEIEYSRVFTENRTGQIDNATGTIAGLGGTTGVFTVDGYPDYYNLNSSAGAIGYSYMPADGYEVNLYGDNKPVLVARVHFAPNLQGSGVANNATDGYVSPQTDLGFAFTGAVVKWSPVDATTLSTHTLQDAELWPVMYDLDDDGQIGLGDLSYFAAAYGHLAGEAPTAYTWASDFDHDGQVALGDLSYFASAYGRMGNSPGRLNYPANFPAAWQTPAEGAALLGAPAAGPDADSASPDAALPELASPGAMARAALSSDRSSPEASSDEDSSSDDTSGGQTEAALAQAFSPALRSQTVARRKIDAIDLVMRFYDPMR